MKGNCLSCGDIDFSPCSPTVPVDPIPYKKCNPCKKVVCLQKIDSDCVYYKLGQNNCGQGLKYLDIQNSTSINDIVEVIDENLDTITKPTLINCFVDKSGLNINNYRLNDVLLKLQEGYCTQNDLNVATLESMLTIIKNTPALKTLFCEIVSSC